MWQVLISNTDMTLFKVKFLFLTAFDCTATQEKTHDSMLMIFLNTPCHTGLYVGQKFNFNVVCCPTKSMSKSCDAVHTFLRSVFVYIFQDCIKDRDIILQLDVCFFILGSKCDCSDLSQNVSVKMLDNRISFKTKALLLVGQACFICLLIDTAWFWSWEIYLSYW